MSDRRMKLIKSMCLEQSVHYFIKQPTIRTLQRVTAQAFIYLRVSERANGKEKRA